MQTIAGVASDRNVLRSVLSVDFPYIALKNEELLVTGRPRPESHCTFIPKSAIWARENSGDFEGKLHLQESEETHGPRYAGNKILIQESGAGAPYSSPQFTERKVTTTSSSNDLELFEYDAPYILPDMGRLYCNVLFDFLERNDKILYDWIMPSGVKYHRRSFLKVLGQEKTWSWNYINVSEKRARQNPGRWSVEIRVNDRFVGKVFFEILRDVIEIKDKGVLPIILTCPHGHLDAANLTRILGSHLNTMFGCFPTIVISKIDPVILDLDAPESAAEADLAPYHRSFYQIIRSNAKRILTLQRRVPLLVNIKLHDDGPAIRIGTLDGASLRPMEATARHAGDARFGEHGLVTKLRRWRVHPAHEREPDEAAYAGGNLLRTFSSDESEARISGVDLFLPRDAVRHLRAC
jgi:hypothetical protein